MEETYQRMIRDSNMVFNQIKAADYDSLDDAKRVIVMLYVPDMSISRSGLSHALDRLEKHFAEK